MAPRTINFGEWSAHLLARLRREAQVTGDPALAELYAETAAYPGVETELPPAAGTAIVVPPRLTEGDRELTLLSTISTFGTAADVTLSELAVEAFYPANAETAMRMLGDVYDR